MTTERQSESARINGAKSHGPISAEGKEKSSRNSLRHGCTASHTLLLACEDPGDLDRMLEKYNAMYKPTTLEEHDLVAEMCSARWRIRRATGIETALIDCEMVTEEPKLKQKFATVDTGMVLSAAFRSLADESHSMDLLTRYESRLRRIHKQAHAMLLRLRQERQSELHHAVAEFGAVRTTADRHVAVGGGDRLVSAAQRAADRDPAAPRHRGGSCRPEGG